MKRLELTAVVVLFVAWMSIATHAQAGTSPGSIIPMPISVTEATEPAGSAEVVAEEQSVANSEYVCPCPGQGAQPWKLPQPCFFQQRGINVGGWIQQGITGNGDDPADRFNGPNGTNDRVGEYQLNQAWLYFVRPTNTNGCGWDLGGRIDVVYGTDWRFGQCVGLEPQINGENNFYGWILPQFYLEAAVNNLTVKMGHFATLDTLEVIPAPMNFFYSHSLLSCPYFDPCLVTGLQAEYKLNDNWTAVAGLNRGWMMFEDPDEQLNFLGGVKWASDSKRSNLSILVDTGRQAGFAEYPDGNNVHDRSSVIVVYTRKITDRFQYGSQYTAGIEKQGSFVHPGEDASWYGTEQLFTYTLGPMWAVGLRYEWVRDNDGSRVAGIGNILLTDRGWNGPPGCAGAYNDLSLGLNYRPNGNLVLRPELRYDWYDGQPSPVGDSLPYDSHTRREQLTVAVDLIFTF